MATRRMFSLDVVDTDKFLDMPASSQNLYFHLGMRADDDGFISSPRKITKIVNCGIDDLAVLVSKGYVLQMGDGLVVIRHWKQNNYLRADRYKPTVYQREMAMLMTENGAYDIRSELADEVPTLSTDGIPMGDNGYTQDRIGKVRLEENSKEKKKMPSTQELFDEFASEYYFSDSVACKIREWIVYKSERREAYKRTGLKSLLSQIHKHVERHGDVAVCDLIDICMANQWRGIIWEKLESQQKATSIQKITSRVSEVDDW